MENHHTIITTSTEQTYRENFPTTESDDGIDDGSKGMSDFETVMNTLYVVLTGIFSVLSMLGVTVIIVTYIYCPELRSKGRHFLVFLSVADFLTAFGNLLGVIWTTDPYSFSEAFCVASPAITAFSSVSSNLWNVCMAVYLYLTLVKGYHHTVNTLKSVSHVICWTIPSIILTVSFAFDVYGSDYINDLESPTSWCWIRGEVSAASVVFWQFFCGKFWEITAYIIVSVFYGVIVCYLKRQRQVLSECLENHHSGSTRKSGVMIDQANRTLTFVPLVFICLRIWGTLRFLINYFDPNQELWLYFSWLAPLQGIGDSSQGFANCVLFCLLSVRVRRRICRPCLQCATRRTSVTPVLNENPSNGKKESNKYSTKRQSENESEMKQKHGIERGKVIHETKF